MTHEDHQLEVEIRETQQRVQKAADELLDERLRGPITVGDLAKRSGLSERVVESYAKALLLRVQP